MCTATMPARLPCERLVELEQRLQKSMAALGKEMRSTFVPEALEGVIGMMLAGPAGGGVPAF